MKKLIAAALMLAVTGLVLAADAPAKPAPAVKKAAPAASKANLSDPASLNEKAPETFKAKFDTSKGTFVIAVTRAWAPNGADRFYNLVKGGYFDNVRFFRVVPKFMVQFGISGDPELNKVWQPARITDDPVTQSNKRGFVTYATGGPNTRTTQIFINFGDNTGLDRQGFAPFGQVSEGMDTVVDKLYGEYGDGPQFGGHGPDQGRVQGEGNVYLQKDFPNMDFIKHATIVK